MFNKIQFNFFIYLNYFRSHYLFLVNIADYTIIFKRMIGKLIVIINNDNVLVETLK